MSELFIEWKLQHAANGLHVGEHFNEDGIVCPAEFARARTRILFVGRESNKCRGDLRNLFSNGPVDQFAHSIGRWAYGLLNRFPDIEEARRVDSMTSALKQIAVINIKKFAGEESADWGALHAYANFDRVFLRRQIREINPQLIVACGTLELLFPVLDLSGDMSDLSKYAWRSNAPSCLVLPYDHPSRKAGEHSYNKLRDRARAVPEVAALLGLAPAPIGSTR